MWDWSLKVSSSLRTFIPRGPGIARTDKVRLLRTRVEDEVVGFQNSRPLRVAWRVSTRSLLRRQCLHPKAGHGGVQREGAHGQECMPTWVWEEVRR